MSRPSNSVGQTDFAEIGAPGQLPRITSIFDFSAEALGQLRLWIEQNPPAIGIKSILGFTQFTFQPATTILTAESTTSLTYADLATVGPTLTGLSRGQYAFFFGAQCLMPAASENGVFSIQANAVTATDNDCAISANGTAGALYATPMRMVIKSFTTDSNTVTMKYRTSNANSVQFANRWLIGIKYANA